ncbi:MAG: histidine kinase dimerization/phospho-acceptor domain-containing protein [Rickettsiales bacterium]
MLPEPLDVEKERDVLRRRIFSSVAHDAKTPLACIIGSLQTLDQMRKSPSPEQCEILIKTALNEAYRLDMLFSEVLHKEKSDT